MADMDDTRAVFVISVAAELAGIHPQTLRIYERKGLIEPQRTPGGSRRYSAADIRRLQTIQQLTNEGMSLTGVLHMMHLQDQLAQAHAEIARLRSELEHVRREAGRAIDQVHRSYRRDLVPVNRSIVKFQR
jgi:MerR family transcriptional regulator, heat shock protein HspR